MFLKNLADPLNTKTEQVQVLKKPSEQHKSEGNQNPALNLTSTVQVNKLFTDNKLWQNDDLLWFTSYHHAEKSQT